MKYRSEFKHGFYLSRNIHPAVFSKKRVLKIFSKFKRKHLYESLSFNKVAGLRSATLLKKRLWHRCFLVNFVKFLRTLFYRTPIVAAFPNSGYLHCVILKALDAFQEKERVRKQRTCNFFFKMVQMRLSRFLKRLETTWNSPEQPADLTQN